MVERGTFFPSFVYNDGRAGKPAKKLERTWRRDQEVLTDVIEAIFKSHNAVPHTINTGDADSHVEVGQGTTVYAARENPPMTREEAQFIGDVIVLGWSILSSRVAFQEFSDTVLPLPPELMTPQANTAAA